MRTFIVGCIVGLLCTLAHAAPPCVPVVYGNQIGDVFGKRTNEGRYLHWYCKASDGKIAPAGLACVHGTCLPVGNFFENLDAYKRDADPAAKVKAEWDKAFPPGSCETATGTLKTVCTAMYTSMLDNHPIKPVIVDMPTAPPAPLWKVKANPACAVGVVCTRPAYTLVNGMRGTKEVARAAVGAACDATRPTLASGADLWAEFGTPGVVALCSK